MRLTTIPVREWPRLAWLAVCRCASTEVRCFIGAKVETADEWFSEAVWAGPHSQGDFDETDLVFGSGGRVRGDVAVFVSAGSTVDRLHVLERDDEAWISNSLPCLVSMADVSLDLE